MNKEDILLFLKKHKVLLQMKMGVKSIGLFGSYARGENKQDSDVDILVELTEPRFDLLMSLTLFLEENFKTKVDVVRKGPHLRDKFLKYIESEIIYV